MQNPEVDIESLTHDGRGVARIDGKAVFVAGALPGERVRIRYSARHRAYDEAKIEELLSRSEHRIEPRCPHFGHCGGCALQHLSAERQIEAKQNVLAENFERIGKVRPERWLPPLSDEPWGYRRKGRLSVKWVEKKGKALVGFREDNPRFVADLSICHTLLPEVGHRLDLLSDLIGSLEAKREIAQIEIAAGDTMVALVFRHLTALVDSDREKIADFGRRHDLAIFLQPKGPDSVNALWPEQIDLRFTLAESGVDFEFKPLDFIQVNAGMNQRMIRRTLELLDARAEDVVLDLFCGLGNFTLPIAKRVHSVVGVEGDEGLVMRAGRNAGRNQIANAAFHAADLFSNHATAPWARTAYSKLLLDPPRSGAAAVFEYLPRKGTDRVVYVSCHPGSLARDAGILVNQHGFTLAEAGVMDMFPHTAHVESIALFIR
jgi:23S rRNA (uracil1939-C5)-methyltransferase